MKEKKSGLEISLKNEVAVLKALHKFGWLRTKDLAKIVWQRWDRTYSNREPIFISRPLHTQSGLRMAQTTLKRLLDKKLVLSSVAPDFSKLYTLSQKGANLLQEFGIDTVSGCDLIREFSYDQYRHRVIANGIAIAGILQGFKVFTERQIAQGKWALESGSLHGKKPDCLILNSTSSWWVEVEKSRKNKKDYQQLLQWLCDLFKNCKSVGEKPLLNKAVHIENIVFICTPVFEKKLKSDLLKMGFCADQLQFRLIFLTSLYSLRTISFL